jgi:hypothetical protein
LLSMYCCAIVIAAIVVPALLLSLLPLVHCCASVVISIIAALLSLSLLHCCCCCCCHCCAIIMLPLLHQLTQLRGSCCYNHLMGTVPSREVRELLAAGLRGQPLFQTGGERCHCCLLFYWDGCWYYCCEIRVFGLVPL